MTEGERWAAELLAELRAARFTPRAWIRFLARSLIRARVRRRARARAHREAVALGVAGLAAWGGAALAGLTGLALAGGLWWLAVVLMLDWHLGMLERPDGTPLEGIGAANVVSLARAGAVPALPFLPPRLLAALLVAAWASDALDGWLARSRDETTRLGLWLDGAVDTILLAVVAAVLALDGLLPGWIAALALARCALPWFVVTAAYFARAQAPPRHGYVSGRIPGTALLAGLAIAALGLDGGAELVLAGALAGLAALAAGVVRTAQPMRPSALR